jgi:hypothetical protein
MAGHTCLHGHFDCRRHSGIQAQENDVKSGDFSWKYTENA